MCFICFVYAFHIDYLFLTKILYFPHFTNKEIEIYNYKEDQIWE